MYYNFTWRFIYMYLNKINKKEEKNNNKLKKDHFKKMLFPSSQPPMSSFSVSLEVSNHTKTKRERERETFRHIYTVTYTHYGFAWNRIKNTSYVQRLRRRLHRHGGQPLLLLFFKIHQLRRHILSAAQQRVRVPNVLLRRSFRRVHHIPG